MERKSVLELPGVIYRGGSQTLKYERIKWALARNEIFLGCFFRKSGAGPMNLLFKQESY